MNTIKDLIGSTNAVVKAINPVLKSGHTKTGWYNWYDHTFPKTLFFITSVTKLEEDLCVVNYFTRNAKCYSTIYVPSNFEVLVSKKSIPQKMLDKYILINLGNDIRRMGMLLGSDPEMFVEDENGQVIPAFNFLGAKGSGKNLTSNCSHGPYGSKPMYWDGFQAEFETQPSDCLAWQTDSVQAGLKGLLQAARKHNPKAKISNKTVVQIPQQMLEESKTEHVQFGCMPSKNVYGMKGSGADGRSINFRPSGGHIHFGINSAAYSGTKYTEEQMIPMVKALDAIIGVACVSLFAKFDNPKRRELYGLAGEYRTPAHGLEYRVLSNAWLIHPMIMNLVFDIARICLSVAHKDKLKYWKATEEETIKCINTCDVELSRTILKRNKDFFMQVVKAAYGYRDQDNKLIFDIFLNGMECVVKDTEDVASNWDLDKEWMTHSNGQGKNVVTTVTMLRDQTTIALKKVA
jgi:hypothetical protein